MNKFFVVGVLLAMQSCTWIMTHPEQIQEIEDDVEEIVELALES